MKAVWYERNGPASEVLTLGDWPPPDPARGEVLVRVVCSGVNPSDVKSRAGRPLAFHRIIPHSDGSGIIEAVGDGVSPERIGQRVWLWNGQWQRAMGTCAQYIALPQNQAVPLPDHVSFEAGACLGIPALTAWQAIEYCSDLVGKTLLVVGAANAVGSYCVQMAKLKGARVIGTVGSQQKADLALALGADAVINYKSESVVNAIQRLTAGDGVDAIIDMDFSKLDDLVSGGALKSHGLVVCYGSNEMAKVSFEFKNWLYRSITLKLFLVYDLTSEQREAALVGLSKMLELGQLKHQIGEKFNLEQTAQAHEAVQHGQFGNVIVTP